jgi:hypothetical protein
MGKMITKEEILKLDRKDSSFLTVQLCGLITDDIDWILEKYQEIKEKVKKIVEMKNEKVELYLLEKMIQDYEKKCHKKPDQKENETFGMIQKNEFGKRGREEETKLIGMRPMIETELFEKKKSRKRSSSVI